jgi:hypothetical protein
MEITKSLIFAVEYLGSWTFSELKWVEYHVAEPVNPLQLLRIYIETAKTKMGFKYHLWLEMPPQITSAPNRAPLLLSYPPLNLTMSYNKTLICSHIKLFYFLPLLIVLCIKDIFSIFVSEM